MSSANDDRLKRLEARSYDLFKEPLTYRSPVDIPNANSIVSLGKISRTPLFYFTKSARIRSYRQRKMRQSC